MSNERFRNMAPLIGLVTLVTLIGSALPADARDAWNREERRREFPVEKMQKNLESSKRVAKMQPDRVIDLLGVKNGDVVADLGAGTGFFAFRLASKVGADGKVYATEVEDQLLEFMRRKIETNHVTNIILVKSPETAPNLPPHSCDKILISGSYYYFPDVVSYMSALRKVLKPGGVVGIIDVDKAKAGEKRKDKARLTVPSVVVEEMARAGYVLRQSYDFLEERFFLIFTAKD